MTSPDPPPVRTRKVTHGTCPLHRGPIGFANVVVTKHGGVIEFDPHVAGACVIRLDETETCALRDQLAEWLG